MRFKDKLASPQNRLRKCSINLDKLATWLVASKTKNKSDSDLKEVRVLAAYFAVSGRRDQ